MLPTTAELFDLGRTPKRDRTNYRYFSHDRMLITIKHLCRKYERQNLLRNHAGAMATLKRIVRLGLLIEGRDQSAT
jgi:hypothetical protein